MLEQLKAYAILNNIPIICDEGLLFLEKAIKEHHVKKVLEIGTAIGYSALAMTTFGCHVDTMERDLYMLELAKKNIKLYDAEHQITLIEADALYYNGDLKTYDLIFIDAAKAQYLKFFEKYQHYLSPNGIIICDNLSFHHLDKTKVNRNTRQLIIKLEKFKTFLENHKEFQTEFFDLGDGMSLTKRRSHETTRSTI